MEVRTYYANTVEAAFALAKQEFGADAMLMQSNRSAPGADPRGTYEVVFAGEPIAPAAEKPEPPKAWPTHVWKAQKSSQTELVRPIRGSVAEQKLGPINLVLEKPVPVPQISAVSKLKQLNSREGPTRKSPVEKPTLNIVCNPGLTRFASPSYALALAGSTGSGKTTTAMKLAAQYGLMASRPCRLIAYDPDRVGTAERLRHFSNLLKIPFEYVETAARLSAVIGMRLPGLTIIDTPGCSRADDHVLAGLAFLLGNHPEVETQLVLRADRKVEDNISAAARFSILAPKRLIVTALDETTDYRDIEKLASAAALPLSFLGTGQRIPDDLEPASRARLDALVNQGWSRTAAAAA